MPKFVTASIITEGRSLITAAILYRSVNLKPYKMAEPMYVVQPQKDGTIPRHSHRKILKKKNV